MVAGIGVTAQGRGLTVFDADEKVIAGLGEGSSPDFVMFGPAPVARDFTGAPLPTRGHLLTMGWDRNGKDVLARVSPFQHIIYLVRLGVNYGGTLEPEESAHMYDLITRRASRLRLARIGPGEGPPSPS